MYCSNGNCGYSNRCSGGSYSALEQIADSSNSSGYSSNDDISYMISDAMPMQNTFRSYDFTGSVSNSYSNPYQSHSKPITISYQPVINDFLNINRPHSVFIGQASQIKEFVEEAFEKTTGYKLPSDITIRVLSKHDIKKVHESIGGRWNDGIQGFAINRKHIGHISEIFVIQGELDQLMLTIGHELGHVLTRKLNSPKDEEAKAFAFSIAWMKTIKENNIANLSTAITLERPAQNGLHNVALDFVLKLIKDGKQALDVYLELIRGFIGVEHDNTI